MGSASVYLVTPIGRLRGSFLLVATMNITPRYRVARKRAVRVPSCTAQHDMRQLSASPALPPTPRSKDAETTRTQPTCAAAQQDKSALSATASAQLCITQNALISPVHSFAVDFRSSLMQCSRDSALRWRRKGQQLRGLCIGGCAVQSTAFFTEKTQFVL